MQQRMKTRVETAESDKMVVFRAGRDVIPVRLIRVQREHDVATGATRTWLLQVEVDWSTWRDIDAHAWFHLAPEHRGAAWRAFTSDQPLSIELRLRSPQAVTDLAGVVASGLAEALVAEHPLLDAAKWYAATVMQSFPGTRGRSKTGFRTIWAEEHGRLHTGADTAGR